MSVGLSDDFIDTVHLAGMYKGGKWKYGILRWFSTTQTSSVLTDSFVTNDWTGYLVEMEKLGNSVQITGSTDVINEPYTSQMRPMQSLDFLKTASNVIIVNIKFFAFDTSKSGSAYQQAAVNLAIENSQATKNDAFVQTRFINAIPVAWQPNFFRPKFTVNGYNLFNVSDSSPFLSANKGDLSIGGMLPDARNVYHQVEKIDTITVEASVRQIVDVTGTNYAKAYPLLCEAFITYQS